MTQVIIAAVITVLIWLIATTYGMASTALAYYLDALIFVLVGMLISYVVISVLSSDQLIQRMNEEGLYNSLNDVLGYAMVISLGSILLNLVFIFHFFTKWGALESLESIIFLLLLFIGNLALMFFLTVITKLLQISKLRAA